MSEVGFADVRQMLAAFGAATVLEDRHTARMLDLLHTVAPFSRDQVEPGHFTASGFVLPPERDALLLVDHPKIGLWVQPGGHLEPTDPGPLAAARREVAEETGLAALDLVVGGLFDVDVHTFPAQPDQPRHLHFDLRFLFRSRTRRLDGRAGVAWVPLGEVAGDESLLRPVAKLRALA